MGKRLFDLVVATIAVVVLSPVMAALAVAVWWSSPGPILYRGVRTGLGGRPFRILKFRTMVPDAELLGGGSTGKNDPRITRAGVWMRRYKLDELPQFINVITGDMSLVGPRPELPQYTAAYDASEQVILSVRPGITDYASIEFSQLGDMLGDEDPDLVYETRVRPIKNALRVKYATDHTFWGDLRLLVRTVRKVWS